MWAVRSQDNCYHPLEKKKISGVLAMFCIFAWVLLPQLCSSCGNPLPSMFRIHELLCEYYASIKKSQKLCDSEKKSRTYCNSELIIDQRLIYQLGKQLE